MVGRRSLEASLSHPTIACGHAIRMPAADGVGHAVADRAGGVGIDGQKRAARARIQRNSVSLM